MKRRIFFKKSAVAAGMVTLPGALLQVTSCTSKNRDGGSLVMAGEEIRSSDYLTRVQSDTLLPEPPLYAKSKLSPAIGISPMPLKERIKRKVVPQRGLCSLAPGGDPLLTGNGTVNLELAGNPYTEQVPFNQIGRASCRERV